MNRIGRRIILWMLLIAALAMIWSLLGHCINRGVRAGSGFVISAGAEDAGFHTTFRIACVRIFLTSCEGHCSDYGHL